MRRWCGAGERGQLVVRGKRGCVKGAHAVVSDAAAHSSCAACQRSETVRGGAAPLFVAERAFGSKGGELCSEALQSSTTEQSRNAGRNARPRKREVVSRKGGIG